MGKCQYCGESAGWFSSIHIECENNYKKTTFETRSNFSNLIKNTIEETQNFGELDEEIRKILKGNEFINCNEIPVFIKMAFSNVINSFLNDDLSVEEEEKINKFLNYYNNNNGTINILNIPIELGNDYTRIGKAKFLQNIMEGILPENQVADDFSFKLQKDESVVWSEDVIYYESATKTEHIGGTQGVSIKIAKGMYYRVGGMKGQSLRTEYKKLIDCGTLVLTNKNLYFSSPAKSFKIPYNKISETSTTEVETRSGIAKCIVLLKAGVSAKPQIFSSDDEWFLLNLLDNMINFGVQEIERKKIEKVEETERKKLEKEQKAEQKKQNAEKRKQKSVANELIKLKKLLDQGVLTQEEFDTQKSILLENI